MHKAHDASVDLEPVTQPSPFLHDVTVHLTHALASFVAENIPDVQGVQVESFLSFPAAKPAPGAHADTLWAWHAAVSSVAENVPTPQAVHFESFDAVPGVYPKPAGQLLTV